jgi:transposase
MLELKTRPPQSEALLELKELHLAREALVKDRTAAKNRGKVLAAPVLKRHSAQRLEQIKRQITAIEAAILEQVQADPDLAQRFAILTSIPGVSAITAFALLIEMPELGALEPGQAASLAGLAPVARQSGRRTGRAFIRGGRANVRQAVHMPALVATRFNPRHEGQVQATDQCREARQGRPHRCHAKADPPRKRSTQGQQELGPKTRSIKTDTLELNHSLQARRCL